MKGIFGRRPNQPGSAPVSSTASSGEGPAKPSTDMPWKNKPDGVACNFAFGHLVDNLQRRLTVDGRIHAETLVAGAGAIAGHAAQRALLRGAGHASKLNLATTTDGTRYLFGEPLNEMLFARNERDGAERLWNLAAGTAMNSGTGPSTLPSMEAMFAHVSRTLGGPLDGMPSVDENHRPHMPVKQLLVHLWPMAVICLTGRLPGTQVAYGEADVANWPAVTAWAAAAIIGKVKGVLSPALALTIAMESAIYASKLDPTSIIGKNS